MEKISVGLDPTIKYLFTPSWFEKHQRRLLWFANTKIGRWFFRVNGKRSEVGKKKITRIAPNHIGWRDEVKKVATAEFRTHNKFSKRIYHGLYPLWFVFHTWDTLIANPLRDLAESFGREPAWNLNLGFDFLIVYPDPDGTSGATTMDGQVNRNLGRGSGEAFADLRANAGGDSGSSGSLLYAILQSDAENVFYSMYRSIVLFDTSALPDACTILSANVSVWGSHTKFNSMGLSASLAALSLVSSNPASNTSIEDADYADFGTTEYGNIAYASFSDDDSAYNVIALDATGRGTIDKTGVSKFGFRLACDTAGTAPVYGSTYTNYSESYDQCKYTFDSSDHAGTSSDPKLTVSYPFELVDDVKISGGSAGIEFLGETAYKKRKFGTFLFGEKTFGAGIDFNYPFPISESLAKKIVLNLTDEITFAEALVVGVAIPQTESVAIAENVANKITLGVSDEVGMTEGLVTENVIKEALLDAIAIVEAKTGVVGKVVTDAQIITEEITKILLSFPLSDVIAITESSARVNEFKRSLSDVVALADTEVEALAKTLSDAISIVEGLAKDFATVLGDTQIISEGLVTSKGFERSLVDVITITDAEIEAVSLVLADTHSLADTISKFAVGIVRGDTMGVGESLATVSEFKLSLSDTISIADVEVEEVVLVLADTQVLADEISKFGVGIVKSDTISITEGLATANEFKRSLSDVISFADSEVEAITLGLFDEQVLADGISKFGMVVGKSDVLAIAEGLVVGSGYKKSLSDLISLADTEIEEPVKILADSISISEGLTIVRTFNLALGDEIAFVEGIVTVREFYRGLVDVMAIADSEVEDVVLVLTDSQSISEGLTRTNVFKRSLVDSVNLADAEVEAMGITLADAISITEGLIAEKITVSELGDSISITESNVKKYVLNLSDVIAISDGTGKNVTTLLADSISFSESLELLRGIPLSDSIAISEDLVSSVGKGLADSITFAEEISTTDVAISKTENIILEGSITGKEIGLGLADSIIITESEEIQEALGADLSDSLAISEEIAIRITTSKTEVFDLFEEVVKGVILPFTESVAVAESVGNATTLSLSDSVSIIESIVGLWSFDLSDSVAISESLTHTIVKTLSDEVSFSEDLVIDIVKPFTESVSIAEAVGNNTTLSHSDSTSITESSARVSVFERSLTDSVSISEGKAKAIVKVLTDEITFSDAEVEKKVNHLSDSVTAIEEISSRVIVKSITDTISIADSEVEAISIVLADVISISESLVLGTVFKQVLVDSVAFNESLVWGMEVTKTETLAIAETLANQTTLSLSDSVSIAESETEDVGVPSLTDLISITETVAKAITKDFTESINITDSEIESYVLNLSDSISIAEAITWGKTLVFTDTQSIVEALAKSFTAVFADSIAISESLAKAVEFYLGLSDSITIADSPLVPTGKLSLSDSMSIAESSIRSPVKTFTEAVSILEVFSTDQIATERLGQKAFLRTKDVNRYRTASMRQKYQ